MVSVLSLLKKEKETRYLFHFWTMPPAWEAKHFINSFFLLCQVGVLFFFVTSVLILSWHVLLSLEEYLTDISLVKNTANPFPFEHHHSYPFCWFGTFLRFMALLFLFYLFSLACFSVSYRYPVSVLCKCRITIYSTKYPGASTFTLFGVVFYWRIVCQGAFPFEWQDSHLFLLV